MSNVLQKEICLLIPFQGCSKCKAGLTGLFYLYDYDCSHQAVRLQEHIRNPIFTLSVEAHAPMVEPELTDVGELHSLTDWQVSDASEEAELDEFCNKH